MGYRLVRALARLLVSLFYRRVEAVGLDRIPASGPLILTANHQNALIDPMLILAATSRRLVTLAKAPLFRNPLFGPLLRLAGALPVQRQQDPGSDMAKNEAMFRSVIEALGRGGAILLFPEGLSQPKPTLMPLRTGAARMLLGAERIAGGGLALTLLPIGLVYHEPGAFRTGWALILVGKPVATSDCVALYPTAPEAAVRRLTERLAEALRHVMVEAEDQQTLRLLQAVEEIWREESAASDAGAAARAAWMQRVMRGYRYLAPRERARIERFRNEVERYMKDLDLAGFTGRQLSRTYTRRAVWRYAVREGLSLLLGLPLALAGIANHLIPYQLTAAVVRRLKPDLDDEATYKVTAGVVLFPLCWLGEGWVAWWLGGGWLLAVFALSLAPAAFFALTWRERLGRFARETRAFLRFLVDRNLHHRLRARRRALVEELAALGRLIPESVLGGRASD
ncbi:MAG: acyltransferase domain-containing protein [Candidatus Rokubacteria bacterium CSP1-6]|nr:MAG: acyltransferase domain-containing protein [Candidatus Rokubacteria bacterium CSP1-6]